MQVNPYSSPSDMKAPSNTSSPQDVQVMFMKLLTAQLENQNPLNPVDPTTFTSQLVQFNMLDQLAQINQTLSNALPPASSAQNKSNAATSNAAI